VAALVGGTSTILVHALYSLGDVVTLWDVLEHLLDPVSALAAVPRWLKPGGLVVVQTQNANSVTAERSGGPAVTHSGFGEKA
jgi:2-polyprenyl-3-methyl-5-hydroxy-6-metoxy-1,4-benzoquinol methylase